MHNKQVPFLDHKHNLVQSVAYLPDKQEYHFLIGCLPDDKITMVIDIKKLSAAAKLHLYDQLAP